MKSAKLVAAALCPGSATAFWRMECHGRAGLARMDPIMSPNETSVHVHTVHGSAGFSEDVTHDQLLAADCTSCAVQQDKSAYWTPALYFQHANGTYELVEQVGGMLAYYFLYGNDNNPVNNSAVSPFPAGFRMIAGNSSRRSYNIANLSPLDPDPAQSFWAELNQTNQADLAQRALGFNCLNYQVPPEGSLYRHYLPDKAYLDANCKDGVRMELMFPSCWNGKDLDSPNHSSHVAYPDLVMTGGCPDGFQVKLPGLFYETIWATDAFNTTDGLFVISNGDTSGFGYHGDFIMGWDEGFLGEAVSTCLNGSGRIEDCPIFSLQDDAQQSTCTFSTPAALATELVSGMIGTTLPGNVAITNAPSLNQSGALPMTTVSYSPGQTVTDSTVSVGGVFGGTSSSNGTYFAAAATVQAMSTSNSELTPAVTSSPAGDDGISLHAITTQYVTASDVVSEIVMEEAIVFVTEMVTTGTVTVTVAGNDKDRREAHLGRHARHQFRPFHV